MFRMRRNRRDSERSGKYYGTAKQYAATNEYAGTGKRTACTRIWYTIKHATICCTADAVWGNTSTEGVSCGNLFHYGNADMHLCGTLYGSFVQQLSKYCVVAFCCDYNWLLYVSENSFAQNESERISCQTNEPVLYDWDAWSGHLYGKYRKRMDLDVK